MNDLATSKPTSIPTRSISSNGPMRKPPPSRQMRSICSWRGHALLKQPQRLRRERAAAAVDQEAGAVGRDDHVACPSPRRRCARQLERPVAALLRANHLEQLHQRRRVEEVHADHVLGPRGRARERRDRDRRGVGGQHRVVAAHQRQAHRTARASARPARAPPRSRGRSGASSSSVRHRLEQPEAASSPTRPFSAHLRKAGAQPPRRRARAPRASGRAAACASRPPHRAARCRRPSCRRRRLRGPVTCRGTPACASRRRRSCPPRGPRWPWRARTGVARGRGRRTSGVSSAASTACFASRTASGGRSRHGAGELQRRVEPAVARAPPGDDAELRAASAASMRRPVSTSSIARCLPITRASRCVPPPPGMIPSRISGWPNSARSRTPRSCRTPAPARSRRRARSRTRPRRAASGSPPAAARSARRAR